MFKFFQFCYRFVVIVSNNNIEVTSYCFNWFDLSETPCWRDLWNLGNSIMTKLLSVSSYLLFFNLILNINISEVVEYWFLDFNSRYGNKKIFLVFLRYLRTLTKWINMIGVVRVFWLIDRVQSKFLVKVKVRKN